MEPPTIRTFPYRGRRASLIWGIVFFGGGAVVLAWQALNSNAAVVALGPVEFPGFVARVFYVLLFLASAVFVVLLMATLCSARIRNGRLEISDQHVQAPRGLLLRKSFHVRFDEVDSVSEVIVNGQRFLHLHSGSEKYYITAILLPSLSDYEEIKEFVSSQVRGHDSEPGEATTR